MQAAAKKVAQVDLSSHRAKQVAHCTDPYIGEAALAADLILAV